MAVERRYCEGYGGDMLHRWVPVGQKGKRSWRCQGCRVRLEVGW